MHPEEQNDVEKDDDDGNEMATTDAFAQLVGEQLDKSSQDPDEEDNG